MDIRKAQKSDLQEISSLLKNNDLPDSDISEHMENFIVVCNDDTIFGCIGMEKYGKIALLRSLAVSEDHRGKGYGKLLTESMLDSAQKSGITFLYLLTTTADKFFAKYGFITVARNDVDDAIKNTAEYKYLCPDSAIVMKKDI